jgi:hypothetical protein
MLTTSANRNLLHPAKASRKKREGDAKKRLDKGKQRSEGGGSAQESAARAPVVSGLLQNDPSTLSKSGKSARSQLVDLVVEDKVAEETERVRARKEGGAGWNEDEPKHFL